MENLDDPVITTATGYAIPRTAWAHIRDGFVVAIAQTYDHLKHPFGEVAEANPGNVPLEGETVIRVTGSNAAVGHLVDSKGNLTPAEGRTTALSPGQPAYHEGAVPEAVPVSTPEEVEPEPAPEIPPPDKPEEA
ncbi:hypothetical protein [Gluconobacter japonicus]|uniref:hypothetical protein n=1 Tax=Gluconobacter japonicus TaxID=376620 RepID=UPI000784E3C0|nr:hypothetical protein [Gluconobacter japonicus]KXV20644.1 hypothetical protein AD935_11220 [Gluconobacter japonicus]